MEKKSFFESYMNDEKNKYVNLETARLVNHIINRRKELNMTQNELAKRTGLKQSAISRFESLYVIPSLPVVLRIINELDLLIKLHSNTKKDIKQIITANNQRTEYTEQNASKVAKSNNI